MSFFQELKRRKVVRTTIAYLGAAFITAQAAQLLVDSLALQPWILKVVVLALIIGFPLVVGLAWAFDVTPSGVERTSDDATQTRTTVPWRRVALPLVSAVLLLGATLAFYAFKGSNSTTLNKDLVAILPFNVSADPQIAYLREGMVDLLAAKLTGEGGPRAADPRGVLSVVRREISKNPDLSDATAVEIGRSVGTGQVLIGSIVGTPKQFTIQAKLLRVPGGKVIVEADERATADSVMPAVDRLVAKLLSLQSAEGPQRLDQLLTTSLPALRAYLDGRVLYRSGHFGDARKLFANAVDIDSTFALAAMFHLMTSGWGEGPPTDLNKSRRTVVANRDRLSKVDHAIAIAMVGDYPKPRAPWKQRLADWDAAVTLAPDNVDALFLYADFTFHWGAVADIQDATERADANFGRVLQMDSTYLPALLHRIDAAMRMDRVDVARRLEPLRLRLDPDGTAARYQHSKRIRFLGDSAALAADRAAFDTMGLQSLRNAARGVGIVAGSVDDGMRLAELMMKKANTRDERLGATWDAIDTYYTWGMPGRANEALGKLREIGEGDDAALMTIIGALYWNGDLRAAENVASVVSDSLAHARLTLNERFWGTCILEQWRLWNGNTSAYEASLRVLRETPADSLRLKLDASTCAEALATIRDLVTKSSDLPTRVRSFDAIMREGPNLPAVLRNAFNIVLGRAAEQAGDRKLAQRAYSRYPAADLEDMELYTTMMRERARLAALNGDRALAIRLYRQYLNLHERAEPALKAQDDAVRAHLAQLVGERK